MPERTLRGCALYPDLMTIYADRGNLTVFQRRCAWRGIGFELAGAGIGDAIELAHLTVEELEAEGRAAGFAPLPARSVPPTEEHVGSEVVLLRA